MPQRKALPRSSSSLSVPSWSLKKLTSLQVTSMVPHGGHRSKDSLSTPTTVGTWIHSGHWGRRLWISQTAESLGSQRCWKVNKHGSFSIPRKSFGPRHTDQSWHHETWLHLDFVDWSTTWSRQNTYEPRISLEERARGWWLWQSQTTN